MSVSIEVTGLEEAVEALEKMSLRMSDLPNVLGLEAVHIVNDHFEDKRGPEGQWLPSENDLTDTGNLKGSIHHQVVSDTTSLVGTNVKYAKTHNQGMKIRPKNGTRLKFKGKDGKDIFVKEVNIHKREFLYVDEKDNARLVKKTVNHIEDK